MVYNECGLPGGAGESVVGGGVREGGVQDENENENGCR